MKRLATSGFIVVANLVKRYFDGSGSWQFALPAKFEKCLILLDNIRV